MTGRIELITGPMYSGKSKELQMRREFYRRFSVTPATLIPDLIKGPLSTEVVDVEGLIIDVTMHDGDKYAGVRTNDLEKALNQLRKQWDCKNVTVAIDEVQFFPPEVVPVIERVAREWGWTVICAGLDYDFRRYEFSVTWELREIADVRIDMFARCAVCGKRADLTQRLHLDGTPARWEEPQIVLDDGSVRYEPRCWRCHVMG